MEPRWRIQLLGGLRAEQEGGRRLGQFRTQKTAALLAHLAYHRQRTYPREELIELFWPEADLDSGRNSLNTALSWLRRQLEPPGIPAGAVLRTSRTAVQLNPEAVTTDVAEFEAALAAVATEQRGARAEALTRAVELYRGVLLPEQCEPWVLQEREWLAQRYFQALGQLVAHLKQEGAFERALEYARRGVRVDPLREEVHGELMQLYAATGQPEAALRQYRELERLLGQDLAAEPSAATRALARQIEERPEAFLAAPARSCAAAPAASPAGEKPGGIRTFLLTDIEGSTRLWLHHPEVMRQALARHDALLTPAIEGHGGALLKHRGEGDSAFAVFARATDAVAAAVALQRALAQEPWPEEARLTVRAALHTGEAEFREGDYYGLAVNHCARLRSVAHGGQTLLSQTTAALVRDLLPEGVSLQDLGTHRLKDLQRAEPIYQLLHPELPGEFPPLRSLEAFAHNLPRQLTRFIGREQEIVEVKRLLQSARLLTLTGAGGCGKTRLALQVAADLLPDYRDGIWFVELAALSDPALVPQTVAAVLGVREGVGSPATGPRATPHGRPLTATLADALRPRSLLLVLDNCEHVLAACAELVGGLLGACPNVRVLATSREGLRIAGEQTYRVPPLSSPGPRDLASPLPSITRYEAVDLFQDRARLSQPTFTITEQNALAVAQVCHRLDGIPLAIELAAARVKALPVEKIAERLDDRFRLLTGGSRAALPRQQTLRALIDWGYDLLTEAERTLLRRLSVFAGGWTLEAAEAICGGDGIEEWEVLDLLTQLVEKSLVAYEEPGYPERSEGSRDGRYRLLETLRQYGRERLQESGETQSVQERHREYYLRLAEEVGPRVIEACDQELHLERLETEHDNLRAALARSTEQGDADAGLRLGKALGRFWWLRGHWAEGRERLERLLELEGAPRYPAACAEVLWAAGWLAGCLGDFAASRQFQRESERIARELGDRRLLASVLSGAWQDALHHAEYETARRVSDELLELHREQGDQAGIAMALRFLALVALHQGEFPRATALSEESLASERASGNQRGIARSLYDMGQAVMHQGDLAGARARYEESLAIWKRLGNPEHTAMTLQGLGDVAFYEGRYAEAQALSEESLAIRRELGQPGAVAESLQRLAEVARARGDLAGARGLYLESVRLRQRLGERRGLVECLEGFARIAGAEGRAESAARLLGAAEAAREVMGALLSPLERAQHERVVAAARTWRRFASVPLPPNAEHERVVTAARAALGEAAFAAAWAQGRAMTLDDAVAFALEW